MNRANGATRSGIQVERESVGRGDGDIVAGGGASDVRGGGGIVWDEETEEADDAENESGREGDGKKLG